MDNKENWHERVLAYWFNELSKNDWFEKNEVVDQEISNRFSQLYQHVVKTAGAQTQETGQQALATIIVLDQFPRNMYRGSPNTFASDELALSISISAIDAELDTGLTTAEKQFLYMPFMHSEDAGMQARCVELFRNFNDELLLGFAMRHKQIIDRFGRFPHRNDVLGRPSTAEELVFLREPGSSF